MKYTMESALRVVSKEVGKGADNTKVRIQVIIVKLIRKTNPAFLFFMYTHRIKQQINVS